MCTQSSTADAGVGGEIAPPPFPSALHSAAGWPAISLIHPHPPTLRYWSGGAEPVHGLRIVLREGGAGWAVLSSVRPFVRS